MRVRWTIPAARDLEAIEDYIARDDPAAAFRVATTIRERTGLLADHPHLGRPGRVSGTREFVITGTPYIIAYAVEDTHIAILRVMHGAQKWPRGGYW